MISLILLPLNPIRVPTLLAGHMMTASAVCSEREAEVAAETTAHQKSRSYYYF